MGTYWTATVTLTTHIPSGEDTSVPWYGMNSGIDGDIFSINESGGAEPDNPNGVSVVSVPPSVLVNTDGSVVPPAVTIVLYDSDDVLSSGQDLYVEYWPGFMVSSPGALGHDSLTLYTPTTSTTTAAPTTSTTTAAPTTTTPLPGSPYYTGGIDIGKYVILVVGPDLVFKHPDLQEYTENGAAAFAGMISQLDSTQSTTNVNLPDEITPAFQFTQSQLNKLNSGIGFVNENLLRI